MWRSVPILALVLALPGGAVAGQARAVLQVGITITGKDPRAKPAPASPNAALQAAGKSDPAR